MSSATQKAKKESDWEDMNEVEAVDHEDSPGKLETTVKAVSQMDEAKVIENTDSFELEPAESETASRTTAHKPRGKTVFIAASPRRRRGTSTKQRRKGSQSSIDSSGTSRDEMVEVISSGTSFTIKYILDILGLVMRFLRRPLAVLLSIYALAFICAFTLGQVASTIAVTFTPLCILPGIGSTAFCIGRVPRSGTRADYPKLVDVQNSYFEKLLEDSAGGSEVALDIRKAGMATRDLATVIRISDLTNRNAIADILLDFSSDAKQAVRGLHKLGAKISGSIDNIMAINDFALRRIEQASSQTPSVIESIWPKSLSLAEKTVSDTFNKAMSVLSESLARLITEAESSHANLETLEERLSVLHSIITREDSDVSSERDELLSHLWTILGGNRGKLYSFDKNLALLKSLSSHRRHALAYVNGALHTLRKLSDDLDDIRDRAAAADLTAGDIPLEVHVKSIQMGLDRLKESRVRAKQRQELAEKKLLGIDAN